MSLRTLLLFLLLFEAREGRADDSQGSSRESRMALELDLSQQEPSVELQEPVDDFFHRLSFRSRDLLELRLYDSVNPFRVRTHDMLTVDGRGELVRSSHVVSSFKYALREIAVDTALVQDSRDLLRSFVEGVFGNTDEEEISISQSPGLQYSDEAWRQKVKRHKLKWGIRLLRWPDPYAYIGGRLGHHDGQEILVWHLRYYISEIKSQRVEALISLPFPEKYVLSTGFVYSWAQSSRGGGEAYLATLRFEKWFPKRIGGVFVGADAYRKIDLLTGYFISF